MAICLHDDGSEVLFDLLDLGCPLCIAKKRIRELESDVNLAVSSCAAQKERADRLEAENARLREAGEKLLRMVEFELQDNAQESPWSGLLNRMHAALEDTDGQ